MPTFLDNISVYNAKASSKIADAVKDGQVERANMLSALKTAANDTSLSADVRLNALTALINLGGLLEVPLPPYFPVSTTYANTQTYVGLHNDLTGLQGGDPIANEFLHLTQAEKDSIATKATLNDITFANLNGFVSQNSPLVNEFALKQDALNGNGFVVASGGTISYDANTYLQNINNIQAGGDLVGYYPNPTISNGSIINQILNGFNNTAAWSAVTASDSILSAIEKLNAYAVAAAAVPAGVDDVALTLPASVFSFTGTPTTGSVMLSGSFINQSQNTFFAGPDSGGSGTPQFRTISANDLPTTGIGTGTVGATTIIPVITYDNYGRITNVATVSATGGGVVNTIDFSVPAGGIYNKTIGGTTADPVINFSILAQTPNYVYAGPDSGALNGVPTFRALVPNDIPTGIPQSKIADLDAKFQTKLSTSLNTSRIFIGNASGVAVQSVVSGDLTAAYSFPESTHLANFTIKNKAVTYAKFADVPDDPANTLRPILLGRFSSGQGPMQQLTLSGDFTLNPTGEIGLVNPNPPSLTDAGDLLTSSGSNNLQRLGLPVDYATKGYLLVPYVGTTSPDIKLMWGEAKGDITYSIDTTTTPGTPFPNFVIGANKVTLGKIQTIATNTILGNNGLLGAPPIELTPAQVIDMMPLQDATTGLTKGVVPASGFTPAAGKSKTDYYLSANNSWEPAGANGGTTTNALTNGTGILSFSFDGGTPGVTVDIDNTIVATLTDAQTLTNKTLGTGTVISVGTPDAGTIWYSNDALGTLTALTAGGNALKYLRVNSAETGLEWVGSTSGIAIGDTITSATAGSVLFAGTAGVLAQENGDFFWDNTNKYLGIGTAVPECGLHVVTSGSANIKGVMNMHFDSNAANQAKFIGARGRGNKNSPSAIQADDAITSLSGRGYKTSAWSNTVGGFYIYASENWTDSITGTYLTFRGVANGGTAITEWGRISNNATTTTFNIGATSAVALTTAATTASIFNTTATTLNIGGAATAVNLGGGSGCAISLGGGANVAELRFLEGSGSGTYYVGLKSPATLGGNTNYVLPSSDGTAGTVLQTNGSGVLSWVNNGGPLGTQYLKNTTGTTITNPTGNTIIETIIIPAGTFTSNDSFLLLYRVTGTISVSAISFQISINTTNTIGGVQVATHALGAGTNNFNGNLAFNLYGGGSGNTTRYVGNFATNATLIGSSTTAIDWSVTQYMIMWCGASVNRNITNLLIGLTPL